MNVLWSGAAFDPSGYGEATRNYVIGLDKIGVKVRLDNRRFWNGPPVDLRHIAPKLNELSNTHMDIWNRDNNNILLFNLTPENYVVAPNFRANIGMTTFETDSLPVHWLMPMRAMDYIYTYSQFNRETFTNAGINRPICVIPHGVDVDRYRPGLEPLPPLAETIRDKYVFGSNFEWSERKNPNALISSYYKAFSSKDNVLLILKTFHQYPITRSVQTIKDEISRLKIESGKPEASLPRIMLITDVLSAEDTPNFYNSLDCYVMPTRGEGWSLTFTESMACGLPTIATGWSGHMEFMNDDNSYLIPFKLSKVPSSCVQNQPYYAGHNWAEPDGDTLVDMMRDVYENPATAACAGVQARKDMCENWTWDIACSKLKIELERMGV